MSIMKRIAEIIEEYREFEYYEDDIVSAISQEFNIPQHSAQKLYQQYLRAYTGTTNHELINDGC